MKEIKLLNRKTGIKLEKIDSKDLAYLVGFICADGYIEPSNSVELGVKLADKELLDYLAKVLKCSVNIDLTLNKRARRFPRARFSRKIVDILNFVKSPKKDDRILPIIPKELNKYLVLGFFDGDGCITWGRRKDRNRIWQKISFTSSLKMLTHIQKILYKELSISTTIFPKGAEKTFVLNFSALNDVITFCDWLYSDPTMLILNRKFNNYQALRLELDKFGGTTVKSTIPSRALNGFKEGVETTGEVYPLNNQNNIQAYN